MPHRIELAALLAGCADESFDDGIRIDSHLEPLSGPGGLVKPAVYGGVEPISATGGGPLRAMANQRR